MKISTMLNIKKIHKMKLNDRNMKLIERTGILKMSKKRIGQIVPENLGLRKLSLKVASQELNENGGKLA